MKNCTSCLRTLRNTEKNEIIMEHDFSCNGNVIIMLLLTKGEIILNELVV